MALTNKLITQPSFGDFTSPSVSATPPTVTYSGGYALAAGDYPREKFTIKLADLVGLGAFTSGDIILKSLPAGTIVLRTIVKPVTAITGVGTAVGYLKTSVTSSWGSATFDLKAAVTATNFDFDGTHPAVQGFDTSTNLLFHVIVDTTCGAVTAGQIDIWVDYSIVGH